MATGTGQIREDELPGIGRRFTFDLPDEQQVCVVIHHTGRRDLYVSTDPDQDARVVTLEDDDARRLGAVVGGSYFTPRCGATGRGGNRRPAHRLGDGP